MRLLLVEHEPELATFIERGLAQESLAVDVARDGEGALDRIRATTYDLVILDIVLPGKDGFAVYRQLRAMKLDLAILMLSDRGTIEDRVEALDIGGDDYLTKPFSLSELSARIRALLRARASESPVLIVGDLTLDPIARVVRRGDRRVDLTAKELALLEYLMRNAGQVVSRTMIARQVWGFTSSRLSNVIDVHINHLRKKIELPDEPRLIHSVRAAGYSIRDPQDAG